MEAARIGSPSAVVYAMPCAVDEVRSQLERMPGLQIHAETPDGRFIVTVEDTPEAAAADTAMNLHSLRGVSSAAMVQEMGAPTPDAAKTR